MTAAILLALLATAPNPNLARLKDPAATPAQRNDACLALSGNEAIPHLEEVLENADVRSCAAVRLRQLGAAPSLVRALQNGSADVRARVAYELGVMRHPSAVDPLILAARDPDPLVSSSALNALLGFDDARVLPLVIELARRQGVSSLAAAHSLARFRDPAVLPVFCELLRSKDPLLRIAAIGGLGEIGDSHSLRRLEPLLKELDDLRPNTGLGFYPSINMARAAAVAIARIRAREASDAAR